MIKLIKSKYLFILYYLGIVLLGCFMMSCKPVDYKNRGVYRLVATTTLVGDLVLSLTEGIPDLEVTVLMGPGVDPHLYKPSALDVKALTQANIIFYNGLMLEGRMQELFIQLDKRGVPTIALAQFIDPSLLIYPKDGSSHPDPHIWTDPDLWIMCVEGVEKVLLQFLLPYADIVESNANKLIKEIRDTKIWLETVISKLPERDRILITTHDAYNYFGRAFDFQVIGVQGISTASEAGLADITSTIDFIREKGVKAVFVESTTSPAVIERISKDAQVKLGGELYADALGTPGQIEVGIDNSSYDVGTWSGMMKHNVSTIVRALE